MKKLIFILMLIIGFILFGCADDSGTSDSKTVAVNEETPADIEETEPIVEHEDDETSGTTETVETEPEEIGGDNDWTNEQPVQDYVVLTGRAEAGPCNLLSQIGAMNVDNDWLMSNYVPGWIQNNDGLFMIRGTFTGTYRFFDFYGTCYSEGMGTDVDGFRLKMVQTASAESHNINNATTLRFAVAQKHFTDPLSPYYEDIPGSFIQAKSEIYNFLGFPAATKNFYELSVIGDTTADAYLFKFELAITKDRSGSEVGHYLGLMANAIIDNDTDFKTAFLADVQALLVKEPWDNLKTELVDRGFSVDPAPLWLTHPKAYYTDLMTRTPTILESENTDQTSQCAIDVNTRNSFAYPIEFADIESAQYIATQLSGNLSIWSVGSCDNGTVFSCPGTQLATIEQLREVLLLSPANLSYNGLLGVHGLTSGQFYLVQNLENPGAPSHVCAGSMAPFGRNLATVDNVWVDSIGYNNTTSWFRRGIKWVTTD